MSTRTLTALGLAVAAFSFGATATLWAVSPHVPGFTPMCMGVATVFTFLNARRQYQ